MAAITASSVPNDLNVVMEYCCSTAEEGVRTTYVEFSGESCVKFFCDQCVKSKNILFPSYDRSGSGEITLYARALRAKDHLNRSRSHGKKSLDRHGQCNEITLTNKETQYQTQYESKRRILSDIQTQLEELKKMRFKRQRNMQFIKLSYDDILFKIEEMRRTINAEIDELAKATVSELKHTMACLDASFQADLDKFSKFSSEMKALKDKIHKLGKTNKNIIGVRLQSLTKLDQSREFLCYNKCIAFCALQFNADEFLKNLSKLSSLGKIIPAQTLADWTLPDQVFSITGNVLHNVKIPDDNKPCSIVAICGLPDGRVLVADHDNDRVKLFDQDYNLVSHCKVFENIYDMCQINSCEVAITQNDWDTNRHEIQFISVQNGKLVKTRTLKLTHDCQGIAHHEGKLYVTTRTALMKYTLKGILLRKLYEDKGSIYRVWNCAVSPSGERIYIVNREHHKLITLSRDGTVLYTFTDPELESPLAVHTTHSGQLLVVGNKSVIQVDSEGKRKLVTLVTESDGAKRPLSVFYNSARSSILVGQCHSKLLELKVDLMPVPSGTTKGLDQKTENTQLKMK